MATRHATTGKGSKWTVTELKAIPAAWAGDTISDGGGLFGEVRARADGSVSIRFKYAFRWQGKLAWHQCGTFPDTGIADIRAERDRARQKVADGINPADEKKAAKIEANAKNEAIIAEAKRQAARRSVSHLFESWAKVELIQHKDGGKEARRMIALHVLPVIGELAVADVRKSHIAEVLDPMLSRGTPRMAKVILGKMRQMFRFAVERDLIEADPTATFKKSKVGGKDVERDRVLSEEEIRELAQKAPQAALAYSTETAIWVQLSTCCRIGELLAARWDHLDLKGGTWNIPAENSKNGKPHTIYLSEFAVVQFEKLKTLNGNSAWCYPNRDDDGPVDSKSVTRQVGDRQRDGRIALSKRSPHTAALMLKGGRWTPHDLRRTGATLMTILGVLPEVAERCLNHVEENRIKRVYQRHTYTNEMREAWRLLGERLELLTRADTSNVATLHTKNRA
ncbi:MAG: tyrosine-type recombinase/integrase [FCB group bacterium]|jgi:integrase|nr:tyrosine-type recombinase/integrase [FCB group bacterium]